MALLMMDGFDYYSDDQEDDFLGKWSSKGSSTTNHNATTGRDGVGQAIRFDGSGTVSFVRFDFTPIQTTIVGFNFKFENHPTGLRAFCLFINDETPNNAMQFNVAPGGTIVAKRGATFELDSSDRHLSPDTWYHIEIKYLVDDSVGTLELRIDGSVVGGFDFGPGDTNALGPDTYSGFQLRGDSQIVTIFDDFYIMDTTGSRLNDFIGDVKIETIKPTGVGNDSAWTALAGANWAAVDETIPDRDTTAVDAVDPGTEDRHIHSNLGAPVPDVVHAVAVNLFAEKLVSGSRNVKAIAFDGTTEGLGDDKFPVVDTWEWHQHIFEDHPTGAAVWTAAEVDAGEFGYRLEA